MTRRRAVQIGGIVVALMGAVWTTGVLMERAADRRFHERVAELEAEGFAVKFAEFLGEAPPGAEDAAEEIRAAYEELGSRPGFPWKLDLTGPWNVNDVSPWPRSASKERLDALAAWLESARPFYDRLSGAISSSSIRFPVPLGPGGVPGFDHVRTLQTVTRLLEARALAARSPDDRLAAIRDLLRLGQRLEPASMIDWMVGVTAEESGLRALCNGVESGNLVAADARRVLDADLRPRPVAIRARLARSEIAYVATVWKAALSGLPIAEWSRPSAIERAKVRVEGLIQGRPVNEPSSGRAVAMLDALAEMAREGASPAGPAEGSKAAPSAEAIEVFRSLDERGRRLDAALSLARVALAFRARRDATGRWPVKWSEFRDDFGGEVPVDPYLGLPFDVVTKDGVVRLSSAGRGPGETPVPPGELRSRGLSWEFAETPGAGAGGGGGR